MLLFTPLLRRWANRLGVDSPDIEDVLQGAFILLLRKLPEFRYDPRKSFRAWLWTVFHHHIIAWRKSVPRDLPLPVEQLAALTSPDDVAEAHEAEYRRYLLDRVMNLVRTDFPEQTWRIFWDITVEGKSGVEVARENGMTPNAVYLIRSRVVARLREELAELDS